MNERQDAQVGNPVGGPVSMSFPMADFKRAVLGGDSVEEAMAEARCVKAPVGCGQKIEGFRDEVSSREYAISGMCQGCQDSVKDED